MELELARWGDDLIRITYWNSLTGEDRIFRLNTDGTVDEDVFVDEDNEMTTSNVNLCVKLRELIIGEEEKNKEAEQWDKTVK